MLNCMCGLVFRSKYVQISSTFALSQYSININTVEVDPHSELLQYLHSDNPRIAEGESYSAKYAIRFRRYTVTVIHAKASNSPGKASNDINTCNYEPAIFSHSPVLQTVQHCEQDLYSVHHDPRMEHITAYVGNN